MLQCMNAAETVKTKFFRWTMATEVAVMKRLKGDVENTFIEVRKALEMREKLLLRQVDVIAAQCQQQNMNDEIKFIPDDEVDLMECIRSFGKFNLGHLNFNNDLYVSEDYICPSVDHETMYKCLNTKDEVDCQDAEQNVETKDLNVEFFNEKILKENLNSVNESIVNMTLREAKELIEKAKPIVDEMDDFNEKPRLGQVSQTDSMAAEKFKKPNITINNCNGVINLKNISNLTINCTGKTSIQTASKADSAKVIVSVANTTGSEMVTSSTVSDDENDDSAATKDNESNSISCEFYNRLIKEIKNSIKQHHQNSHKNVTDAMGNNICSSSSESNANDSYNRKLLLKNFENLKIVLENNENETHPVQIEQWLTEIISETEIEPMQNTGILEHSKFIGKNMC